jgi:phenol hydroxylase P0 protein
MIMPFAAFEEFYQRHHVKNLSHDEIAQLEYERMKWRWIAWNLMNKQM